MRRRSALVRAPATTRRTSDGCDSSVVSKPEHLPLAEIRHRLESLSEDEIEAVVDRPPEPPADSALAYLDQVLGGGRSAREPSMLFAVAAPPAAHPVGRIAFPTRPVSPVADRSQWERISLDPDVELHVRRPLTRPHKKVERLIAIARELFEED